MLRAPFHPRDDTGERPRGARAAVRFEEAPPFAPGQRLMGAFADFAFMIYLLFMHNNIDPPLGGLVNAGLLPNLQSESITRE